MVWSLSKDDDGLESVHPLTNQGAVFARPAERAPAGVHERAARSVSNSPSVHVDPRSQVPDTSSPFQGPQSVETTMVLKGRKLDELRAQVARQKATHQSKKQKALLLWAVAGGAALSIGWFVGIVLSPKAQENAHLGLSADAPVPPERAASPELEPLPQDEIAEAVAPEPAQGESETPARGDAPAARDAAHTDLPSDGEIFTLDDLPPD